MIARAGSAAAAARAAAAAPARRTSSSRPAPFSGLMAGQEQRTPGVRRRALGALGIVGSLTCSASMIGVALGLAGAAAAAGGGMSSMAGVSDAPAASATTGPLAAALTLLVWAGPAILLLSLVAIGAALTGRRRRATGVAVAAGILLFWGMYLQPRLSVMLVAIGVGLAALLAAYLWAFGWRRGAWRRG